MKKNFFWLTLLSLIFLNLPNKALADTNPLGFVVEPIYTDEQIDTDKPYFYVKTEPGVEQELKVKLTGVSDEPVTIKSYVANAITSELGSIDYVEKQQKSESLKNSIEEIVTIDHEEFTLAKNEEKIVTISIKTPPESYDGVKLGTVYFKRVDTEEEEAKNQIKSVYSYRIGIMLSESENTYSDSQTLNFTKAEPKLSRAKKSIIMTLENPEPKMIGDFSMKVKILNKDRKVLKVQSLEDGSIAPNTSFNYLFDWGIETIKSGKYVAKISATSRHKSWELERAFEISEATAKEMNEKTVYKIVLPIWAYIVTILLGVSTVAIAILIIKNERKGKQMEKSKIEMSRDSEA